ncbi:hypothetical protein I5907_08145 [Panacibacter sp. DH6]|uniref:Uncharacterized protein n=1 Tax=Panacibacter microcysteis TaxID=2793269 RepID=A0A931E4V4_9BACT|nr:hypothetical protein [Panacibacter microcysteis]MBG9376202.1 hypothetical protein [Panacibacter microcysteis]
MMEMIFSALMITAIFSCSNTHKMSAGTFDQYARTEQATDSFLHALQQQNEVVLAFAVESNAWVRAVDYRIIALNKGTWKGYTYYKRTSGAPSQTINDIEVVQDSCNAAWHFVQANEAWKISGDNGKDFCAGERKSNCNIYDGVTWRLMIITRDRIADPSYYEPRFYDDCCPGNTERKLFITTTDILRAAAHAPGDDDDE